MHQYLPAAVAACLSAASIIPCPAAERIALVIGNDIYDAGKPAGTPPNLANAISDSRLVAKTLRSLGFEVITKENAGVDTIYESLVTFQEKAKRSSLGVFYFSGHGIEVDGKNYVIPVDARLESKGQIRSQTVGLETILKDMGDTGTKAKMVILDCCRNDPFSAKRAWMRSRSRAGGLAEVADRDLPESTLIMYSSGPGQTASDGVNGNSPFTEIFSEVIAKPGVSCLEAFFQVSDHVKEQTGGRQQPWVKFDGAADAFRRYTFRGDPPSVRPGTEAGMVSISDQDLANMKEEIERMKEEIEQARLDGLQPVAQVASPTQEQLAPRQAAEQSLEEFLISWFQNQASNSASLWASDFSDFPKYCYWEGSGGAPRSFLVEDRQKLITRYAQRQYQQLGNATVEWFDNFTRAILVVSLHYEYSGQKRARGNTFMTMNLRWLNEQWKIVGFDETVRRNAYASSASQGQNPQSSGGGAITDQMLGAFISGWKRNQTSNNASDWVSDFAGSVSYCYKNNGQANHSYLRSDRAKLIRKRPNRSYQITDAKYQRQQNGDVEAKVTYRYDYGGSIKGRCIVTMTLRRPGNRILIISYDEKVIKN